MKKEGMTVKFRLTAALLSCALLCSGCGRRADSDSLPVSPERSTALSQTAGPETTAGTESAADTVRTTASASGTGTAAGSGTTGTSSAQSAGSSAAQQTTDSKELAAAKENCARLLKALETAQSEAKAVQQSLTAALDRQRAAEQAYQKYSAEHRSDLELYEKGSLGFFTFVGAADAVDVLKNAKYASSTRPGEETDATSLTNMAKSFDFMRECNQLRAEEGLGPLLVTDRLMAIAQSDLNWSDKNIAHSEQFNVGENLSWNYKDPFDGWYTAEKAEQGGHYLNIVNKEYVTTGFAVCTAGRSRKYKVSHGQVFQFSAKETFTVDQYEKRFRSYSDSISAIRKEQDALKKTAESRKQQAQKLSASLKQKQTAVGQAQTAYEQALSTCEALGSDR